MVRPFLPVVLLVVPVCTSCSFDAPGQQLSRIRAIYGVDDRQEVNSPGVSALLRAKANGTVALVEIDKIEETADAFRFKNVLTVEQKHNLCPSERFVGQPSLSVCSGFLAAPDIVVTAGHCVRSVAECKQHAYMFGYNAAQGGDYTSAPKSAVYFCDYLIKTALTPGVGEDFAVIKLTRPVEGIAPLPFRRQGKIAVGQKLAIIGHPSGLPAKIADNGVSLPGVTPHYFRANIDAFHGNSGSPVFDSVTGVVEGILVEGASDYITAPEGCKKVRTETGTFDSEKVASAPSFGRFVPEN